VSDATRNFSLRLSADDYARLERIAARFDTDRTGALRQLIRRATNVFPANGCFTPIARDRAGMTFPMHLTERTPNDAD
jgi:predicted transcriptional regulator